MSLSDILSSASGLSDLTISVVAILLIVWLVNKFLEKQQEQTMLHNEQMDKTFQIIANFTETLSELVALIREGNEKTDNVSDKVDEVYRKIENLSSSSKKKDDEETKSDKGVGPK